MTVNFERFTSLHFDNQHPPHRHTTIDHPDDRHQLMNPKIKSSLHNYGQKDHQNQNEFNTNSIHRTGPSLPPLIPPSTKSSSAPPINTTPKKNSLPNFEEIEQPSI